jgi:hypothetical protein
MPAAALKAEAEPSPRERLVNAVAALKVARDRLARLEVAFHEAGEASLAAGMALEEAEERVKELAKSASAERVQRLLGEAPADHDGPRGRRSDP